MWVGATWRVTLEFEGYSTKDATFDGDHLNVD